VDWKAAISWGVATAQRGLQRGRPVLVDFSALPVWEERPGF
jgi:hypothetical protein